MSPYEPVPTGELESERNVSLSPRVIPRFVGDRRQPVCAVAMSHEILASEPQADGGVVYGEMRAEGQK